MSDFRALFGRPPEVAADAPGRVNLIGEHTDYSGGFVLPLAIPQRTTAELARREDRTVRAWSANLAEEGIAAYRLGEETPGRGWLDYVQGVTRTLAQDGFTLDGFDLRLASEVPLGSGLSSSAALEVSLLRALRRAFGLELDDVRLALAGQRAENRFVGAPVGVMDQMAASLADTENALFLDTRSLCAERVPLPPAAEIAVIDSGVEHRHAGGEYRVRRAECERAADLLGVDLLRDVRATDLPRAARLPEPLGRRVRHVVTENGRVLAAVEAMRGHDLPRLGQLLYASHRSLKDDFEVTVPELDLLVELARAEPAVWGARMTGGGFGGSVVVLARRGEGRAAGERIVAAYAARGHRGDLLVPPLPDR